MSTPTLSLASAVTAILALLMAAPARALDLTVSHETAGPGETILLELSNAPADARVAVFVSMDNTPTEIGPLDTRCGELYFTLDLHPRGSRLGGARGLRASDTGEASFQFELPSRLPPRLDGSSFYFQAVALEIVLDRENRECSLTATTSNLESTQIVLSD